MVTLAAVLLVPTTVCLATAVRRRRDAARNSRLLAAVALYDR